MLLMIISFCKFILIAALANSHYTYMTRKLILVFVLKWIIASSRFQFQEMGFHSPNPNFILEIFSTFAPDTLKPNLECKPEGAQ